jgi:hypothetical protein
MKEKLNINLAQTESEDNLEIPWVFEMSKLDGKNGYWKSHRQEGSYGYDLIGNDFFTNSQDLKELILTVHKSQYKGTIAVTGAGTACIGKLLQNGNGSNTLLKAIIPYSHEAWEEFLGKVPEKTVSSESARKLALQSFMDSIKLDKNGNKQFGLGATSSVTKDNEREGRQHFVHLAYHSNHTNSTVSYEITGGKGIRISQENLVADLILVFLAQCLFPEAKINIDHPWLKLISKNTVDGSCNVNGLNPISYGNLFNAKLPKSYSFNNCTNLIFSGSFNPIHEGHKELANIAEEIVGSKVTYELSVTNFEKPPLDLIEIDKRIRQFDDNIVLTNTPLFIDKVKLFPNSYFVIGIDTFKRLISGDTNLVNKTLISIFYDCKCKFIIFGRKIGDKFETVKDCQLSDSCGFNLDNLIERGLIIEIPESKFRKDISSSEIRNKK